MTDTKYMKIKNPDDAVQAHREQSLVGAIIESATAQAEADAMVTLRKTMPSRATALGSESFQVEQRLEMQTKRRDGLRKLTGMSESDIRWSDVAAAIGQRLVQEEELLVRSEDEAVNAAAYNVDPNEARFQYERHKARVAAFQKAYTDAEKRADAADNETPTKATKGHPSEGT